MSAGLLMLPRHRRALFSLGLVLAAELTLAHSLDPTPGQNATDGSKSPVNGQRANTASINQICSTQKVKNSNLCKPCQCNPGGSKSPHCDIYTRRCSCLLGYTGNTCNKCSDGFFNDLASNQSMSSTELSPQTDRDASGEQAVQCARCDDCHQHWHNQATSLKENAIRLMERAHKIDQDYADRVGVAGAEPRLRFVGDRTTFVDIDKSISEISELILEDKQKADRVTLIDGELESIAESIELGEAHMKNQTELVDELHSRISRLSHQVDLQSRVVANLSASIARLNQDISSIQEHTPRVASRLIENSRDKTRKALESILDTDRRFSTVLYTSIDELDLKLHKIRFTKRQLDIIGLKILSNSIKGHLTELTPSDRVDMSTPSPTNASTLAEDASKLSERRRFASVIADCWQLSVLLHQDLAKAMRLSDDFTRYTLIFQEQRKTIASLHNQMDPINADLEERFRSGDNYSSP